MRNYKIESVVWLNENEFTCVLSSRFGQTAGYGWSKGGSFFIYMIHHGSISRLGTVKRMQLEVDFPPPV